jgi:hypothetical protein
VDELSRLDAEGRAIHELTVNEDVTVNNHLTGLSRGAGNAGTNNQGIETHLKKLNQVLTSQALGTTGLLEDALELCLTDAVLGAKTLLLTKTDRVVRVGLALGATVLARSIGTLLEVLGCLRGERNAQSARQAGFTAGT